MEEKDKVRAKIVLAPVSGVVPPRGEKVMLHAADDTWHGGFRCVSDPLEEDGEQVVWVAREEEYQLALRENRVPAGSAYRGRLEV